MSSSDLKQFLTFHRSAVQFRDLDLLGHVNNAVYFSWMEDARVKFLVDSGFVDSASEISIVVAHTELDYIRPVFGNQLVDVELICSRLGGKSFDLSYILRVDGNSVAKGMATLVYFDIASQRAGVLPDDWRKVLSKQAEIFQKHSQGWN